MSAVLELAWPDLGPSYEWYRELRLAEAEAAGHPAGARAHHPGRPAAGAVQAVPVPQDLVLLPGKCAVKIRQREKGTLPWPVPVMDPTGDLEVLARRVAALETLVGCLLWAMAKSQRRAS